MALRLPLQNQVIITGRLTHEPEFRSTQKGTTVCFFDIASNRRIKDPVSQEWKDDTTYVPIVLFGTLADRCRDKIKKGTPVYIEGRLSNSEYTNKDGVKITRLKVIANRIQILETKSQEVDEIEEVSEPEGIESTSVINESDEEIPF